MSEAHDLKSSRQPVVRFLMTLQMQKCDCRFEHLSNETEEQQQLNKYI